MAYVNLNFVPGEILTAAKMNLLAANDASFHDGTGISDGSIQPDKLADSLKTYKSTEMDTGKKWINGKSIYQKSITFNTTGSGAEETGANNENFSYIDTLISLDAILNMPNGERYPNSYTNPSAPSIQYFQLKFANWNNAQVLRYQTRSVGTITMTILYTKK